jgi:hypothetical protein
LAKTWGGMDTTPPLGMPRILVKCEDLLWMHSHRSIMLVFHLLFHHSLLLASIAWSKIEWNLLNVLPKKINILYCGDLNFNVHIHNYFQMLWAMSEVRCKKGPIMGRVVASNNVGWSIQVATNLNYWSNGWL